MDERGRVGEGVDIYIANEPRQVRGRIKNESLKEHVNLHKRGIWPKAYIFHTATMYDMRIFHNFRDSFAVYVIHTYAFFIRRCARMFVEGFDLRFSP